MSAKPPDNNASASKLWSLHDDLFLICILQDFLDRFRSVATYPDLLGVSAAEFDKLDGPEKGRLFEERLADFVERRTRREFHVVTGSGSLDFGLGLTTPSGIRHEVDLVLSNGSTIYVLEAKHYLSTQVTKDMLAVFNQKTLDFYLELLRRGIPISLKRLFVARTDQFNFKVREFAWSWGIALVGGEQRNVIWLEAQLRHWLETRGPSPALNDHLRLAEGLLEHAMIDLAQLIEPFSSKQASIRLDQLLGIQRCDELVRMHEAVSDFWQKNRRPN